MNQQDLLQIKKIIDDSLEEKLESKLEEKLESKLEEKLDSKLEEKLESKLEEKLDSKLEEKLDSKLEKVLDQKFSEFRKLIKEDIDQAVMDAVEAADKAKADRTEVKALESRVENLEKEVFHN